MTSELQCSVAVINQRPQMEDTHRVIALPNHQGTVYAIFDGHAGKDVAFYAQEQLDRVLVQNLHLPPKEALIKTLEDLDWEMYRQNFSSGSTALLAWVQGNQVWLANLGDSRAVILTRRGGTKDSWKIVMATQDHKPHPGSDEWKRIQQLAHGMTLQDGRLWSLPNPRGESFGLATTRSLGDFVLKKDRSGRIHIPDGALSSRPDVQQISLPGKGEHWLVMASDGLWDVLSLEELQKYLASWLETGDTCQTMVDFALQRGSHDNITLLVVKL